MMDLHQLAQHAADGEPGIERGVGILEDHLDPPLIGSRPAGGQGPAVEADLDRHRCGAGRPAPGRRSTCLTRTRRPAPAPPRARVPDRLRPPRAAFAAHAGSGPRAATPPGRSPTCFARTAAARPRRSRRATCSLKRLRFLACPAFPRAEPARRSSPDPIGGGRLLAALVMQAGGGPPAGQRPQWCRAHPAVLLSELAAGMKAASGRRTDQAGR